VVGYKLRFMEFVDSMSLILLFATAAAAAFLGTAALLPFLRERAILDHPNERSSHHTPTPKGGGIVVIAVVLVAWIGIGIVFESGPFLTWIMPATVFVLAVLSWVDDLRGLPPALRLLFQITAVCVALALRPEPALVFQGVLPVTLDVFAAGLLWVWFINLFNFMDGIDGITGAQALVIGLGIGLVSSGPAALLGVIIAGAALGFLKWNWHPAKVFLGDVGSVPLGFLLGWLLLDLAAAGHWAAALILPAYYLFDATITLIRRAVRGEKIWQAHRQHFYQKAVQRGLSHATVSSVVLAVGVVLVSLAWSAEHGWALPALASAGLLNLAFLWFLAIGKK
jgi:UDP-N-acetylmuramyl pentapeptide phosphotransferase/UDP-N-acetylglucosamine-1-phosphate transferase